MEKSNINADLDKSIALFTEKFKKSNPLKSNSLKQDKIKKHKKEYDITDEERKEKIIQKSLQQLEENTISKNPNFFFLNYVTQYHFMLFIGIVLLLIGIVGYLLISGTQLGSSNTEFSGGLVKSSTNSENDGEINHTTEVIAELFAIIFLIVGLFLIVRSVTLGNVTDILKKYKQYQGLLILNDSISSDSEIMKEAQMAELANKIKENPPSFLRLLKLNTGDDKYVKDYKKQRNLGYLKEKYDINNDLSDDE